MSLISDLGTSVSIALRVVIRKSTIQIGAAMRDWKLFFATEHRDRILRHDFLLDPVYGVRAPMGR